jgi:hypothetical protein
VSRALKIPSERIKRLLPIAFLIYGLISVFTLQRDFSHVTKLTIFVLLIGPTFLFFGLLGRVLERLPDDSRWSRYKDFARMANLSATQTMAQYILIFCLPFYVMKSNWIYFAANILLLGLILWDPVYERLVAYPLFRHMLLAWSLVAASSFLFPFVLPGKIAWFYPALAVVSGFAFIPTRKEGRYFIGLAGLWTMTLVPLLVLPPEYRFPLLSVWTKQTHFAWDVEGRSSVDEPLARTMSQSYLKDFIGEGHRLCCVAPIVAPPGLSTTIRQEWTLGGRVIESTELRTPIQGNASQQAFHSYFCKRNFPLGDQDEWLRCRIKIGKDIDVGGTAIEVTP